jgi:hypothetical protein
MQSVSRADESLSVHNNRDGELWILRSRHGAARGTFANVDVQRGEAAGYFMAA